jgi:hypothetical protein
VRNPPVGQSGVVGRCQIPEDKKPKERKEKKRKEKKRKEKKRKEKKRKEKKRKEKERKKRKELIHFIDSNPDFVWKKMKGATTRKNMHVNMTLKTVLLSINFNSNIMETSFI